MAGTAAFRGRSQSPGRRKRRAEQDKRDVVLLVGGTGRLGGVIAKHLAHSHQSAVRLMIGGRSVDRGQVKAAELSCEFVQINVEEEDSKELGKKLESLGVDMVVNAVGPFHEQRTTLLEAALETGCHYLDVCDDIHGFARRAKALHQKAVEAGSVCVTTAGVFPGLSNLVAASMIEEGGGAESVRLDYHMVGSGGFGNGVMVSSMNGSITSSIVFRDGKQETRIPFTGRRLVDFGPVVGSQPVYHFALPECFSIHEVYQVPNVRAMFGTAPDFFNYIMLASGFLLKLMPRSWNENFANVALRIVKPFDWWLGRTFAMRIAVLGKDRVLRVHRQTHLDGFEATGDTVARQVMAILQYANKEDGSCEPGVWFAEEAIKGQARGIIIEHSVAGSITSDVASASAADGVVSDQGDLDFAEEHPVAWLVQRILIALPCTIVFSQIWDWPAHIAFAIMVVMLLLVS